jgi:hypothetical protein
MINICYKCSIGMSMPSFCINSPPNIPVLRVPLRTCTPSFYPKTERHLIQTMSNGQKLTQSYLMFGSQWNKPTEFPFFWTLIHALRTPVLTDICVKWLSTSSYNDTYCLLPLPEVGYQRISTEHRNEMDNYCSFTYMTVVLAWGSLHMSYSEAAHEECHSVCMSFIADYPVIIIRGNP